MLGPSLRMMKIESTPPPPPPGHLPTHPSIHLSSRGVDTLIFSSYVGLDQASTVYPPPPPPPPPRFLSLSLNFLQANTSQDPDKIGCIMHLHTHRSHFKRYSSLIYLNWCPVIVSNRQQVSPILSLAVISLLIDQ